MAQLQRRRCDDVCQAGCNPSRRYTDREHVADVGKFQNGQSNLHPYSIKPNILEEYFHVLAVWSDTGNVVILILIDSMALEGHTLRHFNYTIYVLSLLPFQILIRKTT